ncbi:cell envelope integrity protein CreD [Pseudomonas floridensis]|uniref:Cell envelope integrity protein CreD n=1 Tax=Pseudomonas floridensis TaxID=1958950 RepID=A0A1X0N1Z7_9PSED|nr:cell envelope integrity protein CreD [Pseudomonas floridensis]ORC56466.1 cell envelope integrity protein CreD [Pseudomonas floridensis]
MNRNLAVKLGTIALLIILLLIPLLMIGSLITDRQVQRDGVLDDIARSSSFRQRLTGPLIVVPYRKNVRLWKTNAQTDERYVETAQQRGHLYFLPERFELDGKVQTELRSRGIYEARLYHADNRISGQFVLPEKLGVTDDFADYSFERPYLAIGISDIRGIESSPKLQMNGQALDLLPGSRVEWLGEGVSADLPGLDGREPITLAFAFDLRLQGTGQFEVTPVGKSSSVQLSADWPHPGFIGNYLPTTRTITDQGFNATWQASFFSTNLQDALSRCLNAKSCEDFKGRSFGVSFVDPVDQYLKSDRAIKYALLFVALTFAGFFLFEVLKSMAVHPVQYALVGAALALFYLMLLSLSEHLGFATAYLLSASACVGLIGFYVSHVLRSVRHGLGFAAGLSGLYGLLYGLLSAEDYALLMGALLLFGLLSVFMVLTRKLDWYSLAVSRPPRMLDASPETHHE